MAELRLPEINNFSVSGRLTRDPEVAYTRDSKAILSFDIANNYTKYSKATKEYTRDVTFFSVKMFGERASYYKDKLQKGSSVCIDGNMRSSSWTDKSGQTKTKYVILANRIQVLDKVSSPAETEAPRMEPRAEPTESRASREDNDAGGFGGDDFPF